MPAAETTGLKMMLSGALASVLATLGVDPATLVWGLVGATLGLSLAPKDASRMRSALIFSAVVLAAALIGTVVAEHYGKGILWRNLIAMGMACLFHPLLTLLVAQLPDMVQAARERIGLATKKGDAP